MLLVDRLGLLRAAYFAAKQSLPDGIEAAAAAALAALHGVTMGDGALSSWQGGNPGDAARLAALDRRLRPARPPAARRRAAGAISGCPRSAPSWCSTPPRRRRRKWPPRRRLDPGVRTVRRRRSGWWSIAAAPARCRPSCRPIWSTALRTTAAHSTLILADTNSTAILADGSLGKGVADVTVDRSEDNDSSRIEATHDGYVRRFGLIHKRSLMLGNDGKELRGADQLIPKGRRKVRGAVPFAVRFHLAPGVEATLTADGMGAILRSQRRAAVEFPLPRRDADDRGKPRRRRRRRGRTRSTQLVIVGEMSGIGGEVGWQFRRAS